MKNLKIGKHDVEFYDNIDELPVVRFHKWQKYLLIDSGVGADMLSFDQHIERARRFCKIGKSDLAEKELMNLRQNVYFIQQELSPAHLAFATLVTAVDGKRYDDFSDTSIQELSQLFSDISHKELTAQIDAVKKKINAELMLYFPQLFADSDVKEYYDLMRKKTMLILNGIMEGKEKPDETDDVEKVNDQIILYSKPKEFSGSESAEIQFDKQFENQCLMLSQKLNIDAHQKTTMQFYVAFEYLKDRAKREREATKQARVRR